jgi:hypothetical protein
MHAHTSTRARVCARDACVWLRAYLRVPSCPQPTPGQTAPAQRSLSSNKVSRPNQPSASLTFSELCAPAHVFARWPGKRAPRFHSAPTPRDHAIPYPLRYTWAKRALQCNKTQAGKHLLGQRKEYALVRAAHRPGEVPAAARPSSVPRRAHAGGWRGRRAAVRQPFFGWGLGPAHRRCWAAMRALFPLSQCNTAPLPRNEPHLSG